MEVTWRRFASASGSPPGWEQFLRAARDTLVGDAVGAWAKLAMGAYAAPARIRDFEV